MSDSNACQSSQITPLISAALPVPVNSNGLTAAIPPNGSRSSMLIAPIPLNGSRICALALLEVASAVTPISVIAITHAKTNIPVVHLAARMRLVLISIL